MNLVYILTGGNLGNRLSYLDKAAEYIGKLAGRIIDKSSVYETEPWGFEHENCFLNQVIVIETILNYRELFEQLQLIEKSIGRKKSVSKQYMPREIDLDILFFNQEVIADEEANLFIPHPRLHLRKFALIPLCEVNPGLTHPLLNKTVKSLLLRCEDDKRVTKYLTATR